MDRPEVLALFARQHWVAGVAQLHELKVGRDVIYLARRKGLVTSPVRGVLAVADVELSFRGRAMAALLAASGHEAFVSGPSAGVIHGLRNMPRSPVEISVREDRRVTLPPWARLVRTSWIVDERDVVELPDGLRVATPLRTLFGLARRFNQHRFERAAEDLWHRRLITPEDAASYLSAVRQQGKTGVARFEEWLERALPRERPSQSGLELDFVDLIARLGLPTPARQYPLVLPSGELIHLDLAWPDVKLAVEPGHTWWHGGNLRMTADAARDRACDQIGWRVLRYTQDDQRDAATGPQLVAIYRQRRELWRVDRPWTA